MTIKSNVQLHPWQRDTILGILKYPHDIHVVKAPRQRGKSICMEQLILYFALNYKRTKSIYISPSFAQCEKVYTEILNAVKSTSVFQKCNGGLFQIHFVNGSSIQFLAASQGTDHLQGYTCSGIMIIDESSFIDDDIHYAVFPFVDANRAPMVLVSTPQFRQGVFYDMFTDESNHVYDWCTYDTSCMLSNERLEQYRKNLPKIKFAQQFLGQFTDANSGVFGQFTDVVKIPDKFKSENSIVFGIDWGTGSGGDDTAISVWCKETKQMIDLVYFNDKNATETVDVIVEMCKKYNTATILVETNSIGEVYRSLLKKKISDAGLKTTVQGFTTSNSSKEKLVDMFCVAIQNKTLSLIHNEKLFNQMNHFIAKPLSSGKIQYQNDKPEIHDDCVMATMIGYKACCTSTYVVR